MKTMLFKSLGHFVPMICMMCLFSCGNGAREGISFEVNGEVELQPLDSLIILPDSYGDLKAAVGGMLVYQTETSVYRIMLDNGGVTELVSIGEGPAEVVDFTSVGVMSGGKIGVYDGNSGKLLTVSLPECKVEEVDYKVPNMLNELQYLDGDRYIGIPYGGKFGYLLFDKAGNQLDSLAYFPPKPNNVNDWSHSIACSGPVSVIAGSRHFARSVAKDGGIDFFKVGDDGRMTHLKRVSQFDMEYDVPDDGYGIPVTTDKSRCGYYSLCNDGEKYYALYSGASIHDNPEFRADELHVFGKDGKPLAAYGNVMNMTSISYDDELHQMYGIMISDEDDSPVLVRLKW